MEKLLKIVKTENPEKKPGKNTAGKKNILCKAREITQEKQD